MAFYLWVGFAIRVENSNNSLPTDRKADPRMRATSDEGGTCHILQCDKSAFAADTVRAG